MAELDPAKMPTFNALPYESQELVRAAFRRLAMGANIKRLGQLAGSYEALIELLSAPYAEQKKED